MLKLFLVMVSWIRGLTYFRIFDSTRYLITLVFEVLKDMISFMTITFYSVIGLSLMLHSIDSRNYSSFLGYTYMTTIGEYTSFDLGVEKFNGFEVGIFTMLSIVNTIVMMNLLISIIGDTFDRVQQGIAVADLKQLGEMIYEIESLMYWNRGLKETVFMQKLSTKFGSAAEGIWDGKVREMKKAVDGVYIKLHLPIINASKHSESIDKEVKLLKDKVNSIEDKFNIMNQDIKDVNSKLGLILDKLNS